MADFGKLNFSVAFNPTSAFPLDARSYCSSYEEALEKAQQAVPVGSTDGLYYFGEHLVVVTDTDATLYIIEPNKTLSVVRTP